MSKKVVFISHFSGEAGLSTLLKELIEERFLNMIEVFSSSHPESLQLGSEWFSTIKTNLASADLIIVLCSPISITKPWINFEAGCGFIRNIPVIPLCHSGLKPHELRQPLVAFQGAELNSADAIKALFTRIAEVLESTAPPIDASSFIYAVKEFEKNMKTMSAIDSTQKIVTLIYNDIFWTKATIVRSVTPIDKQNDIRGDVPFIHDMSKLNVNFNDIYGLFDPVLYTHFITMKNYQLLYECVTKLVDNIKFIFSASNYKIPEQLDKLFDEFLSNIALLTRWYKMVCLQDSNVQINNGTIKMIKEWERPVEYLQANVINTFVDYYRSVIFLRDWIIRFESTVCAIIGHDNLHAIRGDNF